MKRILIIHGHENDGKRLSEDAKARCRLADNIAYGYGYPEGPLPPYDESPVSEIIFSGGLFSKNQNGIPNSQAMKNYLEMIRLSCFHDSVRPLLTEESKSLTTIDNVEKIIPMIEPQ